MLRHRQISQHHTLFYEPELSVSEETLIVPSGRVWFRGTPYALPAYTRPVGTGAFRLWVEWNGADAGYLFDATLAALPRSFGSAIGALLVAWRDDEGQEIEVLQHVDHP